MAHFAKIENNKVVQVIVVDNKDINNQEFPHSEPIGQNFINTIGLDGFWLQTSYNKKFRGNFAGIDYVYDSDLDVFVPPKPFDSWILDKNQNAWIPPTACPGEGYMWSEKTKTWVKVPNYEVE